MKLRQSLTELRVTSLWEYTIHLQCPALSDCTA